MEVNYGETCGVSSTGGTHVENWQFIPLFDANCGCDSTSYQSANPKNNPVDSFSRCVGFVGKPRFLIFSYQFGTLELPDLGF
jgi:hypothetical protein